MLPSTGLFKGIVCPYYDSTGNNFKTQSNGEASLNCKRPFCHFKHIRKGKFVLFLTNFKNNAMWL